jgi:hypothetical protein
MWYVSLRLVYSSKEVCVCRDTYTQLNIPPPIKLGTFKVLRCFAAPAANSIACQPFSGVLLVPHMGHIDIFSSPLCRFKGPVSVTAPKNYYIIHHSSFIYSIQYTVQ